MSSSSSFSLFFGLVLIVCVSSATICSIDSYGAKTSASDNTNSIQSAINACINGGTVVIPAGKWTSYPLTVTNGKSFTLQFQSGAILAAGTRANWPVASSAYTDFLVISGCTSCTVVGPSSGTVATIDGGGTPWYEEFDQGVLQYHRPFLVVVKKSSNFKMLHLTIKNSPMFNVVLNTVQTAEIGWVSITDDWYNSGATEPHNTDGIDPGSDSSNIHIHDCYIYNGDDSIAVKPGTTAGGCTRDILVENCEFHRGHGCSIGSIGSGCIKNVMFRNIKMYDQMGGCVVKAYNDAAGSVTNITWQGITMSNTAHCIRVSTQYKAGTSTPGIAISGLHFDNVVGTGCTYTPEFDCQAGKPCTGITLKNVNVPASKTSVCAHAAGTASGTIVPASCLTATASLAEDTSSVDNGFVGSTGYYAVIVVVVLVVVLTVVGIIVMVKRRRQTEVV